MGLVIKEPNPSQNLTHKNYNNEEMMRFFGVGFLSRERKERDFFFFFSKAIFSKFPHFFFS